MMPHFERKEKMKSTTFTVKSPASPKNGKKNDAKRKEKDIDPDETEDEEEEEEEESPSKGSTSSGTPAASATIKAPRKEDFDEVPEASSPAPAPTKGGADDVFTVAHVAKIAIKVNKVPTTTSTTTAAPKQQQQQQKSSAVASAGSTAKAAASSADTDEKQKPKTTTKTKRTPIKLKPVSTAASAPAPAPAPKKVSARLAPEVVRPAEEEPTSPRRSSRRGTNNAAQQQKPPKLQDDEDDSVSSTAPMEVIDKSPYEPNLNAEKGVKMFEEMNDILLEDETDEYRSVNVEATKMFGPTNAWCLVKANTLIDKSGMVYSEQWVHGNIQGNMIGKIPPNLLLLCLVSSRFIKASEQLLQGVSRDLQAYEIVKTAVESWGLEDIYPNICNAPKAKNFHFTSQKRSCLKCTLFVARSYSCHKAFMGRMKIDNALMTKLKACLDIMENHLDPPSLYSGSKKRKKMEPTPEEVAPATTTSLPPESPATTATAESPTPMKRKRGRPPKNKNKAIEATSSESATAAAAEPAPASASSRRGRRSSSGTTTTTTTTTTNGGSKKKKNKKDNSLQQLVKRLEGQYDEMGKRYKEMGETLTALKTKIVENREAMEQEIRDELLQEVQHTLMKNGPSSKK